ncbi:hypothetical protein VTL71DRAFT_695 [Oculimacula yallundae]|uniref:Uncharacterized protein n=1 Tax=Oculimacula yallundae TaxID=86028 RepID=A0ABR4D1Q5_9HELO
MHWIQFSMVPLQNYYFVIAHREPLTDFTDDILGEKSKETLVIRKERLPSSAMPWRIMTVLESELEVRMLSQECAVHNADKNDNLSRDNEEELSNLVSESAMNIAFVALVTSAIAAPLEVLADNRGKNYEDKLTSYQCFRR